MRKFLTVLIIAVFTPIWGSAQICTGNLGSNIFPEGDFGSGAANLFSPDPNIAPGYTYTFNVPPLDGEYVLTNSTADWPGLFPSWLGVGDWSADPNGYMMVVNASNTPGLFYQQSVSGLCENTLYEFSADILNLVMIGTPDHIDPNVSFLLDGVELFTTGDIPKTNAWANYGFTFTTAPGQLSLTLSLRNNAPGGNGNDLAIDNISFRTCGPEALIVPEESTILCAGNPAITLEATIMGTQYSDPAFQWQQSPDGGSTWLDIPGANGNSYTPGPLPPGTYRYRFLLADGSGNLSSDKCRVISNEKTVMVNQTQYTNAATICAGQSIQVGTSTYSESGVYTDTLMSGTGCDSVITTTLTVSDNIFSADLTVRPPSCFDLSDGSISIENIGTGIPPYQFTLNGIDFGSESFFPDLAGDQSYTIGVQDALGCTYEVDTFLASPPPLTLELGSDLVVELGEPVLLSPDYNFSPSDYNWQSTTPIDCPDFDTCLPVTFLPAVSQQVFLELFSAGGCSVTDDIFIEVLQLRSASIPDAFTPNGDGINDLFTIFGQSSNIALVEKLRVYNRWGQLVFENQNFPPNDLQSGWDGTFKGAQSPMDMYLYSATIRYSDNQVVELAGELLLMR